MTIEVSVGDTVVEFPDGTSDDVIRNVLRKNFGAPKPDRGVMGRAHDEGLADVGATWEKVKKDFDPSGETDKSLLDVLGSTLKFPGKAMNATLGMLGAYPTGVGSSMVGREALAPAIRTVGELINPDVASKQTNEDVYQKIKPDVGLALSAIGARGAVKPNPQFSKEVGDGIYSQVTAGGNAIPVGPVEFEQLAKNIAVDLQRKGLRPSNVDPVYKDLDKIAEAGNANPDLTELVAIKKKMRNDAWEAVGEEKKARMRAMEMIDNEIRRVDPGVAADLRAADFAWSKFKQGERVEGAIEKAKDRAASSGTGGNLYNTVKQEMRRVKDAPEGLTPGEVAVAERAAKGPVTRNLLSLIGKLDPTSGAIPLLAHGGAAALTGGMNIPVAAAGFVARHLSQRLALKDANRLAELIQSRTPETRKLSGPMQEWAATAQKFGDDPSPKNFARLTIASRNFSHNLSDFGISVSPTELLKSLQGTNPAHSEDEE